MKEYSWSAQEKGIDEASLVDDWHWVPSKILDAIGGFYADEKELRTVYSVHACSGTIDHFGRVFQAFNVSRTHIPICSSTKRQGESLKLPVERNQRTKYLLRSDSVWVCVCSCWSASDGISVYDNDELTDIRIFECSVLLSLAQHCWFIIIVANRMMLNYYYLLIYSVTSWQWLNDDRKIYFLDVSCYGTKRLLMDASDGWSDGKNQAKRACTTRWTKREKLHLNEQKTDTENVEYNKLKHIGPFSNNGHRHDVANKIIIATHQRCQNPLCLRQAFSNFSLSKK